MPGRESEVQVTHERGTNSAAQATAAALAGAGARDSDVGPIYINIYICIVVGKEPLCLISWAKMPIPILHNFKG